MHLKLSSPQNTDSGFALLMSLIVVGVLITIGISVLELTVAQISLSTNARDSERAFHAANAGVECAIYVRRQNASDMETGQSVSPTCFGVAAGVVNASSLSGSNLTGDGEAFIYTYEFTWGSSNDRCSQVTTLIASSTPSGTGLTVNNMTTHIPGYPITGNTLDCEAGGRCTVMSVRGYNKQCSAINSYGTVQREVLLQL